MCSYYSFYRYSAGSECSARKMAYTKKLIPACTHALAGSNALPVLAGTLAL